MLPAGLAIVVVFASLSGTSDGVARLVGFRARRGLRDAMFVATVLAVIVVLYLRRHHLQSLKAVDRDHERLDAVPAWSLGSLGRHEP